MATHKEPPEHKCMTRTEAREGKDWGGGGWAWAAISPEDPFLSKPSSPVFFGSWVFIWEMRLERKETSPMIYVRFFKKFVLKHSWHAIVQWYVSFGCACYPVEDCLDTDGEDNAWMTLCL